VILASEGGAEATRWGASYWHLSAKFDKEDQERSSSPDAPSQTVERVQWSERTRQFLEAYRAMQRTTESVPLPEILDPAKVEPLSLVPSDVLRTFAQKKGKSIVALLDDNAYFAWFYYAIEGRDELKFFMNLISDNFYYPELQEMDNLIRVKPRFSSYKWDQRASRQAISDWLRRILQQKYMRLEDHLALLRLTLNRQDVSIGLESLCLRLVVNIQRFSWLDSSAKRFLASLTAEQIARLRAGQELPLSAFSAAQRELLVRDLYFGTVTLATRKGQSDWEDTGEITIHQVFPDGLPLETRVGVQKSEPERGTFTVCRAGVWSEFRSFFKMAYDLAFSRGGGDGAPLDEILVFRPRMWAEDYQKRLLMPALCQPFMLEVHLGEDYLVRLPRWGEFLWGDGFSDYELLNDGKPTTLDSLPQEIRDTIQRQVEEFRKFKSDEN